MLLDTKKQDITYKLIAVLMGYLLVEDLYVIFNLIVGDIELNIFVIVVGLILFGIGYLGIFSIVVFWLSALKHGLGDDAKKKVTLAIVGLGLVFIIGVNL